MSDRGIKKWAPYKSLKEQDFALKSHKEKDEFIEKPKISGDFADEINEILVNYHGETLTIKYYKNGKVIEIIDKIKKIDIYDKKLVLSSKRSIMITDIVFLERNEEEDYEKDY